MRKNWLIPTAFFLALLAGLIVTAKGFKYNEPFGWILIFGINLFFGGGPALLEFVFVKRIGNRIFPQLQQIGIQATKVESKYKSRSQIKLDKNKKLYNSSNFFSRMVEDLEINQIFDIRNENIDYIFYTIDHERHQHSLEYIVIGETKADEISQLWDKTFKTQMTGSAHSCMSKGNIGKSIEWKGDPALCQRLKSDQNLNDRILNIHSMDKHLKNINIIYKPKYGYTIIEIPSIDQFYKITSEEFSIIDKIAKHVKNPTPN